MALMLLGGICHELFFGMLIVTLSNNNSRKDMKTVHHSEKIYAMHFSYILTLQQV